MPTPPLKRQDGYSMVVVMFVMLVGTLVSIGAWQTATGDIRPARVLINDQRAYAAGISAVADYQQKLDGDNEYWLKCTTVPPLPNGQPAPINQPWNGVGADPRRWRSFPGGPNVAYTIELLPRPGFATCQPNVDASMLSPSGTIQIRTTGRSGPPGTTEERKRSLVTTLRRNGFLDFLYFTEFETRDPLQRDIDTFGRPVKPCAPAVICAETTLSTWADQATTCRRYVREGRNASFFEGSVRWFDNNWYRLSDLGYANSRIFCGSIQFLGSDINAGPFHSNDTISLCGQPRLGRNRAGALTEPIDRVEYWAWVQTCSGAGPDTGNNTLRTGTTSPQMSILRLPDSNTELLSVAQDDGLVYTGRTQITLNTNSMTVVNNGLTQTNVPLPTNGVIYVQNGVGCPAFSAATPYAGEAGGLQNGCGDALVSGIYGASLTIAAARDVHILGDVTGANNSLLGLIANNFVRIRNAMASYPCNNGTAQGPTPPTNRRVEAAILSLGHVFTVDNYQCGDTLGNLSIVGAIAQRYRGPVGTFSGGIPQTGFIKNYRYDDRLRYRSPPYFLAPVQSAWRVVRTTEQVPAV